MKLRWLARPKPTKGHCICASIPLIAPRRPVDSMSGQVVGNSLNAAFQALRYHRFLTQLAYVDICKSCQSITKCAWLMCHLTSVLECSIWVKGVNHTNPEYA